MLEKLLGPQYEVVADAVNGRGFSTYSNAASIQHAFASQPFQVCVIMLGTNDAASEASLDRIQASAVALIDTVRQASTNPRLQIILAAPPPIQNGFDVPIEWGYHQQAARRASELNRLLKRVAARAGCRFLDAGPILAPVHGSFSSDGVHISTIGSRTLTVALSENCSWGV